MSVLKGLVEFDVRWLGVDRKVDVRLPGKGNSNSHGARPVHLIMTMIKWIRTSRLSIKNSLWLGVASGQGPPFRGRGLGVGCELRVVIRVY